ncbi:MAG TPA: glycosyltransferase family 39 protein [Bacteroidota bacterium]|nr:glycosyltransferase family 39 protein [Bacteroidota bacterium]
MPLHLAEFTGSRNRRSLLGILAVALALRCAAIAVYHSPLVSDDKDYVAIAHSIVHGDGIALDGKPTAYRLPGYPLLLACSYSLFGETNLPIKILQALADVGSCMLLFLLGRRLFSEKIGLVAAAILALFPIQILYVTHLMTETLFTTILLLIIWIVLKEEGRPTFASSDVIVGILIGVGSLLRATILPLPLVIFLYRQKAGYSFRSNLKSIATIGAVMIVIISPWIGRNAIEFHRISMTSNAGVNFWMGNHPGASGAYSFPRTDNPLIGIQDDFQRSDAGFKLGLEFVRSHPLDELLIVGKKFAHFFAADYWLLMMMEYKEAWATAGSAATIFRQLSLTNVIALHAPYVLVLLLGTFGLVFPADKESKTIFFFRTLLLYWLIVHLVFYADARYRFPIVPIFMLTAAYGWFLIRDRTFLLSRMRLAVFIALSLLYIGGWLGEILTLRSKATQIPSESRIVLRDSRTSSYSRPSCVNFHPKNTLTF